MFLKELFKKKFVITCELGPPKGTEVKEILENAEKLKDMIDAFNVTDLQSSVMRLGSLAVSHLLKENGYEPVWQITCRDRNRLALQSDILSAAVLGIENVLVLTGDHPNLGDHPGAKPVFDLDSVQLLRAIRCLENGYDLAGKKLIGTPPHFSKGAVVSPVYEPIELQIIKMEKKISEGAEFFQTQAIYDVEKFLNFMEIAKKFKVPIMVGIVILKSEKMARFMNKNVAGISIPESIIEEMEKATDKKKKGIEIAARIIKEVKDYCQGVHIMPLGWEKFVPTLLEQAGLRR